LTFDASATSFSCPVCGHFCNCSHCARARGEEYVPERNGGWRKWGAWPAPAAAITSLSTSSSKQKRTRHNLVGFAKAADKGKREGASVASTATQVFKSKPASEVENWRTTVFTVTGEPLGEAFFEGNTARIVSIQPAAQLSTVTSTPQSAPAPARTPLATITTAFPPEAAEAPASRPVPKSERRRHVFIGKPRKSWGRLVSVPDPEKQQKKTNTRRGARRGNGKRKRVRVRMFIGSEKPLFSRRVKKRHRFASLTPNELDCGENADQDVDQDADEGVWPGEYVVPQPAGVVDGAVDPKTLLRITPEDVESAIVAAFAVGPIAVP
jgi:hypothetical protein